MGKRLNNVLESGLIGAGSAVAFCYLKSMGYDAPPAEVGIWIAVGLSIVSFVFPDLYDIPKERRKN